jgi:hypothetical protein
VRNIAAQLVPQRFRVIRVHLHVELSARHRYIGHTAVDEFAWGLFRVHVDQYALCGLALAAVACHRITVIEMWMLPRIELDLAARVRAEFQIAVAIDPLDGRQRASSQVWSGRRRPPHRWCRATMKATMSSPSSAVVPEPTTVTPQLLAQHGITPRCGDEGYTSVIKSDGKEVVHFPLASHSGVSWDFCQKES